MGGLNLRRNKGLWYYNGREREFAREQAAYSICPTRVGQAQAEKGQHREQQNAEIERSRLQERCEHTRGSATEQSQEDPQDASQIGQSATEKTAGDQCLCRRHPESESMGEMEPGREPADRQRRRSMASQERALESKPSVTSISGAQEPAEDTQERHDTSPPGNYAHKRWQINLTHLALPIK